MVAPYQQGSLDAYEAYGVKVANASWGDVARTFGRNVKEFVVGRPLDYANELRNGQAFKPHGMLHNAITGGAPGTPWYMRALNVGSLALPVALTIPQLANMPAEYRGSATGQFAGSVLGSTLGGPVGMVGSVLGSVGGQHLGDLIGRQFNEKPRHVRPSGQPHTPQVQSVDAHPLSSTMSEVTGRPTDL